MQLILLQWLYMVGLYEKDYIVMAVLQWLYEKILLRGIYYTCFITLTITVTLTAKFTRTLTAKFTSSLLHNLNMPITQSPSNNKISFIPSSALHVAECKACLQATSPALLHSLLWTCAALKFPFPLHLQFA